MRRWRIVLQVLLVLGALAVVLPASSALAEAGGRTAAHSAASVRAYWTPARMRAAVPAPLPSPDERAIAPPFAAPAPQTGEPGFLPPSPPAARSGAARVREAAARANTGEVTDQTEYPQSTNGKLFFSEGRIPYECSASVVKSESHSVILTAGHCVFYNRWSSKIIFVPAYDRGSAPFGKFTWAAEATTKQWLQSWNFNYDYAAIRLRPNSRGRVGNVVGEQGLAWNYNRDQDYRVIGYPSNFANAGVMWGCSSVYERLDGKRRNGPPATGVDCNMGEGASGGGWSFLKGSRPYVGSVTSYGKDGFPGVLFGPYFTSKVKSVIRLVEKR